MTYKDLKEKYLSNPEVKKAYDDLEPEYQLIREILNSRNEQNLSQQNLSELTGINRSDISRIENGNANPSLRTMNRIAKAFNKKLKIQFV